MSEKTTKRINMVVSQKVYDYYKSWSHESGVSMSGLMAIQLEKSMNERETIGMMALFRDQFTNSTGNVKDDQ